MQDPMLKIYSSLTRQLETFVPLHPPRVGVYLCGPTVYGAAHLGHARSAITFDVVVRTLRHLGYQVRYVRNITDVGHLVGDADEGEDKVASKARLMQLSPMEVAYQYMQSYDANMQSLNVLPPNLAPCASGHITDQQALIQALLDNGFAYATNGSVYFDVARYHNKHGYGMLSGSQIANQVTGTRSLHGVAEKRNPLDFALWKKAGPQHLMQWPSPWGKGFPGWHLACTAMSIKHLGTTFDIHGGGMDLRFPHHECELAQARAAHNTGLARYWMHNNLVMLHGQKMSKSANNFITLEDCFAGKHQCLTKGYAPMVLRFCILQTHYRSTLNFSDEALKSAERGFYKLLNGYKTLQEVDLPGGTIDQDASTHIEQLCQACYVDICDDFNTAKVIAHLFDLTKYINRIDAGSLAVAQPTLARLKKVYKTFFQHILGLSATHHLNSKALLDHLVDVYKQAKGRKDYTQVDSLRHRLKAQGIAIQDRVQDVCWRYGCDVES